MVFPAVIREKSQRWVALSCDAHLVPTGLGRIGQPCVRSSSESDLERTFFSCSPFCAGNSTLKKGRKEKGGVKEENERKGGKGKNKKGKQKKREGDGFTGVEERGK